MAADLFRFQISDFRFQISDFRFQISDFRFQIPDFGLNSIVLLITRIIYDKSDLDVGFLACSSGVEANLYDVRDARKAGEPTDGSPAEMEMLDYHGNGGNS
jgi:hypothetical protein